ncbi:MAG: hypothetical protein QXV64_00995 [Candidatus Anstonellaceae archaeon]
MNIKIERVKLNPSDADWFFKTKIDFKKDKTIRARFDKKEVRPDDWDETKILAQKYVLVGQNLESFRIISNYVEKNEENPEALYYYLLFIFPFIKNLKRDYYHTIEEIIERAIEIDPSNYNLYLLKAYFYKKIGERKKIRRIFEEMESKFLLEPRANIKKALEKIDEGKKEEALKYVYNIEKLYQQLFCQIFCLLRDTITSTNTYSWYDPQIVIEIMEEKINDKQYFFIEGIKSPELDAEDYTDLAIQYIRINNYKKAQEYAQRSLEISDPARYEYRAEMIKVLISMATCKNLHECTREDYLKNFEILNKIKIHLMSNKEIDYGVVLASLINSLNAIIIGGEKDKKLIKFFLDSAMEDFYISLKIYPFFDNFNSITKAITEALTIKYVLLE